MIKSSILKEFMKLLKNGIITDEEFNQVLDLIAPHALIDDTFELMEKIVDKYSK